MTCTRQYNGAPGYDAPLEYNVLLGYESVGYDAPLDYNSATWWDGVPGYNADLPYNGCDTASCDYESSALYEHGGYYDCVAPSDTGITLFYNHMACRRGRR